MSIIESIQNARKKGIADKNILDEIKKQNKEKRPSLVKAEKMNFSATEILNEIIKQNTNNEDKEIFLKIMEKRNSGKNFLSIKLVLFILLIMLISAIVFVVFFN